MGVEIQTSRLTLVAFFVASLGCPAEDSAEGDTDTTTGGTTGVAPTTTGSTTSTTAAETTSTGQPVCEPGALEACACADGTSSNQICLADGSGFSACDCVGVGTTAGGDSSGSSDGSSGMSSDAASDTGSTGEPPPECDGAHPIVEGDLRFCERGNCYCGVFDVEPPFDTCYPMDIAEPCCPVEVVCY